MVIEKNKYWKLYNLLQLFFGLPFLNSQDVENCFTDDIMAIQPQVAREIDFKDYVLDTYIKNDADFPPKIWAEFSTSSIRTTNNCEAFHRKLNSLFSSEYF